MKAGSEKYRCCARSAKGRRERKNKKRERKERNG